MATAPTARSFFASTSPLLLLALLVACSDAVTDLGSDVPLSMDFPGSGTGGSFPDGGVADGSSPDGSFPEPCVTEDQSCVGACGATTADAGPCGTCNDAAPCAVVGERLVVAGGDHWAPGVAVNVPYSLLPGDPSVAPRSVTYAGRGMRRVFDRRKDGYVNINAYVYDIVWPNTGKTEFVINPEVGGAAAARKLVDRFVPHVGRLPFCLRTLVKNVRIHQGDMPLGGGDEGLLIYAGRSNGTKTEEIFVHEAAHNLGQLIQISEAWKTAQRKDEASDSSGSGFISKYARENPTREDVSESFLAWLVLRRANDRLTDTDRNFILGKIPNRLSYFDRSDCNTFPVGSK